MIVGLIASPERIIQIRTHRLQSLSVSEDSPYVDRVLVADEVARSRKLFAEHNWPVIDVTRRSIEETAAEIIDLHKMHQMKYIASS